MIKNSLMIKQQKSKALSYFKIDTFIKVGGKTIKGMGKAYKFGKTDQFIKDTGKII